MRVFVSIVNARRRSGRRDKEQRMSAFLELVIVPAVFPWLVVMVAELVEDRLDRQQQARTKRNGGHALANGRIA